MGKETESIFSQEWVKFMEERARVSRQVDGSPDVATGYYAAKKVKGVWRLSNGRTWWDNPVVVREIHEHGDGVVTAHYYVEGIQTFSRRNIENSGLRPLRPSELAAVLPIRKVVYFDHRKIDGCGKVLRVVHEVKETAE